MDISVVIPTKDRPRVLYQCICSVLEQTVLPDEVIIVDDGNLARKFVSDIEKKVESIGSKFQYIKKGVPGLSMSRNIGASIAKNSIVLFLDDDVVLDKEYVEVLKEDWERHKAEEYLGGIGGVIKNMRKVTFMERLFHRIFLLSSPAKWDVTAVGFQVWTTEVEKKEKVFYLPGGVTSFKKDLIGRIPFRQLSPGRTPADDVEFFLKVKKEGYYFILDPRARLFHRQTPTARENNFARGEKEGYNQCVIFKDNVEKKFLNRLIFYWSSIGWILRQFLAGNFLKAMGMVSGYIKTVIMRTVKKRNE